MMENSNSPIIKKKFKVSSSSLTKRGMAYATVFFLVMLTTILSLYNVEWDPSKVDWKVWIYKTVLLLGLFWGAMLVFEFASADRFKSDPQGPYMLARGKYDVSYDIIKGSIQYFSQFFTWARREEVENKEIEYLCECGFTVSNARNSVRYVKESDIETLKIHSINPLDEEGNPIMITDPSSPYFGKKLIIGQIKTSEQEKALRFVLSGGITIKTESYTFYLTAEDGHSNVGMLEEAPVLQKEESRSLVTERIVKTAYCILVALFWAAITIKDFYGSSTEAWFNLITRLAAIVSGAMSGVANADMMMGYRVRILENKAQVLSLYDTDMRCKRFSPDTENDEERKSYELYEESQRKAAETRERLEAERKQKEAEAIAEREKMKNDYAELAERLGFDDPNINDKSNKVPLDKIK